MSTRELISHTLASTMRPLMQLSEVEQRLDNVVRKMSLPGYAEKTPEAVRKDQAEAKARIESERVAALQQLLGMQKLADTK